MDEAIVQCFCNTCHSITKHDINANYTVQTEGLVLHGRAMGRTLDHMIITCRGCGETSYLRVSIGPEDLVWTMGYDHPYDCPLLQIQYPPPRFLRRVPDWIDQLDPVGSELLKQSHDAINIGVDRLVVMGLRALLEWIMIENVGDHGSFKATVREFVRMGYLPTRSRKTVLDVLDVGSAAIHRGYKPPLEKLAKVFEIVENVVHTVCVVPKLGKDLTKGVPRPKRKARKKK